MEDTKVMKTSEVEARSDTAANLEMMATRQKVEAENWLIWKLSFRQRSNKDWEPVRKTLIFDFLKS